MEKDKKKDSKKKWNQKQKGNAIIGTILTTVAVIGGALLGGSNKNSNKA